MIVRTAVEVIRLIFGGDVHVSPLTVAKIVISSLLLPLGIGLAIAHWWPATRRWIPPIQKVSGLVLLCALYRSSRARGGSWDRSSGEGTLTAIVVITLAGLAAGHFLGGRDDDDERTVLAFATVSRHPGVAVALASLTGEKLAPIAVLLAVLASGVAVVPYRLWRKRLRGAATA